jgi:CHAT domain-containing protein
VRHDNPLFSCLDLADGKLTAYELETLARSPRLLVLSACESGLSVIRPGDELMGLASTLLALGTRTLVASVSAIPDELAVPVMVALHQQLAGGVAPAAALAAVREQTRGTPQQVPSTALVCFGAG